jgi:hypothetical protein
MVSYIVAVGLQQRLADAFVRMLASAPVRRRRRARLIAPSLLCLQRARGHQHALVRARASSAWRACAAQVAQVVLRKECMGHLDFFGPT